MLSGSYLVLPERLICTSILFDGAKVIRFFELTKKNCKLYPQKSVYYIGFGCKVCSVRIRYRGQKATFFVLSLQKFNEKAHSANFISHLFANEKYFSYFCRQKRNAYDIKTEIKDI